MLELLSILLWKLTTEINNYDYCQINNAINNFLNYFLFCTLKVETSIYKRYIIKFIIPIITLASELTLSLL